MWMSIYSIYLFGCQSRIHQYYWLECYICGYLGYCPLFRSKALALTALVEVSFLQAKLSEKADILSHVSLSCHLSPFERCSVYDRSYESNLRTLLTVLRTQPKTLCGIRKLTDLDKIIPCRLLVINTQQSNFPSVKATRRSKSYSWVTNSSFIIDIRMQVVSFYVWISCNHWGLCLWLLFEHPALCLVEVPCLDVIRIVGYSDQVFFFL